MQSPLTFQDLIGGIDLQKLLAVDLTRWISVLRVRDTVLAGKTNPTVLAISKRGVFLCLSMTGRFTTLVSGEVGDAGVCKMSLSISNSSGRVYIQDPISMDCILTPGRVKSDSAPTGPDGRELQFPGINWMTVFRPTDEITHNVTNDSDVSNLWEINYHGIWITK